jgi:hypothetical protein
MFADPYRLRVVWAFAILERQRQLQAAEGAHRSAINAELTKAGVLYRIARAKDAIRSDRFHVAFNARHAERAAAKDVNDVREIALAILTEMGVDMTDVTIRLRRSSKRKIKMRVTPTVEAAQRAISAADTARAA